MQLIVLNIIVFFGAGDVCSCKYEDQEDDDKKCTESNCPDCKLISR